MLEQRFSDNDVSKRDIPSFIEPRPPLIQNPFMRRRPEPDQRRNLLLDLCEEESTSDEPELVQVYLRLKPCKVPNTLYEVRSDRCLVTSLDTATAGHGRRTQHNVSKMYTFSKIFGTDCNQREIFEAVVKDNLRKLRDGQNFTLLTYGASGSGKTYTLMGTVGAPGLVPRSLEYVFRLVDAAQTPSFKPAESGAEKLNYIEQDYELQWVKQLRHVSAPLRDKYRRMSVQLHSDLTASSIDLTNRIKHYVWVSFVEIYNEAVYDLLAPPEKRAKLRIREDTSGNVYVKGATQAFVRSGEEAYDVMVAGKHNLVVAATGVHAHSSRSHCIFTITMLTETGEGEVRTSYVRLCDLAGCERARATRNTGARMQESRAINSSLHVLERCLHMLRRKQRTKLDAMVPYRESKLTRLLGTGLSGTRGEAVSMVVTLNPSPEYAQETKHVLSLAAVAQDIQINNTMLTTTLESSTAQDTTINCSNEVMKLRADNERLHFELVQAQARNRELLATMEEKQQESANTMWELVEEAKNITKQYYETQLEALRTRMEEMKEEYEERLEKLPAPHATDAGTPSRHLQAKASKVAQLMTEIAVLEEKLTAERLARGRAEKEVEHLRTCIEERDEKAFKDSTPPPSEDVVALSDSDQESEEEASDPLNESLEPIFKKELNKSVSKFIQNERRENASIHTIDNIEEECNSDIDREIQESFKIEKGSKTSYETGEDDDSAIGKTRDAVNDDSKNSIGRSKNNMNETNEYGISLGQYKKHYTKNGTSFESLPCNKSYILNTESPKDTSFDSLPCKESYILNAESPKDSSELITDIKDDEKLRSTNNYKINEASLNSITLFKNETMKSGQFDMRGTYFISDSNSSCTNKDSSSEDLNDKKTNSARGTYFVKEPVTNASKDNESDIFKVPKPKENSNISIVNTEYLSNKLQTSSIFELEAKENTSNILKGKVSSDLMEKRLSNKISEYIEIKAIVEKTASEKKPQETLVNKIIRSLKSGHEQDNSLRQFEQLEEASKECKEDIGQAQSVFGEIKMLKEKRTYFEDVITNKVDPKPTENIKPKRTYFDNINVNVDTDIANKKINQLIKNDDERSPSIVKDVVSDNYEPSTMKKLLGESFNKPDVISSLHKTKLTKKQESLDVFESPVQLTNKENVDKVEYARQSIEKLVLGQKSPKRSMTSVGKSGLETKSPLKESVKLVTAEIKEIGSKEIKLEPMSSVEESLEIETEIKKENKVETVSFKEENNTTVNETLSTNKVDNTLEEFENIYKDITAPRATEFELLVPQELNETDKDGVKYNLRKKNAKTEDNKVDQAPKPGIKMDKVPESENGKGRKRPLRLRRRKNQDEENDEKLKDIVNLQTEFSDVTMDVPAPQKEVKDIPSPEKETEENLPPLMGIQSCPSKSVTRSRRKLFTPRAEPLEESLTQTGDSNERVYVPRPSYHRPRARRKL